MVLQNLPHPFRSWCREHSLMLSTTRRVFSYFYFQYGKSKICKSKITIIFLHILYRGYQFYFSIHKIFFGLIISMFSINSTGGKQKPAVFSWSFVAIVIAALHDLNCGISNTVHNTIYTVYSAAP